MRAARPDEHATLSAIAFQAKASHGYSTEFMEACRDELTYSPARIDSDSFHFLVVEGDDGIEGFVALEERSGTECELEALFVLPAFSGRGVGTSLMRRALRHAIEKGFKAMMIQSDPGAVDFYRSFGAVLVGESPSGSIPGRMLPQLRIDLRAARGLVY